MSSGAEYAKKYGVADPMVSDIIKTLTLQAMGGVGMGMGVRMPSTGEIVGVSVSMGVYWYMVHPYLGDKPLEFLGF